MAASGNSFQPTQRSIPTVGVACLVFSAVVVAVYLLVPGFSSAWNPIVRVVFGGIVVIVSSIGLQQVWEFLAEAPAAITDQQQTNWLSKLLSRNRVHIPREGMTYLTIMVALFIGALLGHDNKLMLVFAMMAGPFVLNGSATYGVLRGASLQRLLPRRVMVGERFSVEVDLTNQRRFFSAWMVVAHDVIQHSREGLEASVLFTRVAPKSSQSAHYQLKLAHRGRYTFGPLRLSSRFPLGLVERRRYFESEAEVLVYPLLGQLNPRWKSTHVSATELVAHPRARDGAFDDEFHRLREYRIGDNPKSIHWRSSAKRNTLVVREYQPNREHNLAILVDLYAPNESSDFWSQRVEWALSVAATMAFEQMRDCRESSLELAVSGKTNNHQEVPASPAGLELLLDQLALAESGPAMGTAKLADAMLMHLGSATRLVLLTTRELGKQTSAQPWPTSPRLQVIEIGKDTIEKIMIWNTPAA